MDCVLYDIDDDGEKEIIAVTYLADLFVIKKEMVIIFFISIPYNFPQKGCIKSGRINRNRCMFLSYLY